MSYRNVTTYFPTKTIKMPKALHLVPKVCVLSGLCAIIRGLFDNTLACSLSSFNCDDVVLCSGLHLCVVERVGWTFHGTRLGV